VSEHPAALYDPGPARQTIGNQVVVLPDGTLLDGFAVGGGVGERDADGGGGPEAGVDPDASGDVPEFPAEPDTKATARHPYYGDLNCFGWLLMLPEHYRAHLEALDRGRPSAL